MYLLPCTYRQLLVLDIDMSMSAKSSKSDHSGLQSYLVKEVENQLSSMGTTGAAGDSPCLDAASYLCVTRAAIRMEQFFDNTDADLATRIDTLLSLQRGSGAVAGHPDPPSQLQGVGLAEVIIHLPPDSHSHC